jgi:hypothetical protein
MVGWRQLADCCSYCNARLTHLSLAATAGPPLFLGERWLLPPSPRRSSAFKLVFLFREIGIEKSTFTNLRILSCISCYCNQSDDDYEALGYACDSCGGCDRSCICLVCGAEGYSSRDC